MGDRERRRDDGRTTGGGESTLTVLIAMGANATIAVLKLVAGLLTGSAAMLAESAHSVADTATEGLLLTAPHRSSRPADRRHPFGYGQLRFFWALIAAVSIFVSGALFSVFEGLRTLVQPEEQRGPAWVAYAVLALAFVLEGASLLRAIHQVRAAAQEEGTTPWWVIRHTDDPTLTSVVLEDSAALVGIGLATLGFLLHGLTGSSFWDAAASLLIGVLLTAVAYVLCRVNAGLLIGRQTDRRTLAATERALAGRPEVVAVVDMLTMTLGTDRLLLCARLDVADVLTSADVERLCVTIDLDLRRQFPDLEEIFLEPVPRDDPVMRGRALRRYGRTWPAPAQASSPGEEDGPGGG